MSAILVPVIILSGIGICLAALLAVGRKVFYVEVDARQEKIMDILPGANCGGCGYAGCSGYAAALVTDGVAPSLCPPGGPELAAEIGKLLGVEVGDVTKMVAKVACAGDAVNAEDRAHYHGIVDCYAAHLLAGGPKKCTYGCLGLGSCQNVCMFDAVVITDSGVAYVDESKCTGCKKCVEACPRNLIFMVPATESVHVLCNNPEKAKAVKAVCQVGCTGCKMCTKQSERFSMTGALAAVDYESKEAIPENAAFACPQGAILDQRLYDAKSWIQSPYTRKDYESKREAWKAEEKARKAALREKKARAKKSAETKAAEDTGDGKKSTKTVEKTGGEK